MSQSNVVITINPGDPMQVTIPAHVATTSMEVTARFCQREGRIKLVFTVPQHVRVTRPINHRRVYGCNNPPA